MSKFDAWMISNPLLKRVSYNPKYDSTTGALHTYVGT